MTDITALSYWFPKLEAAGIPVPKTRILGMSEAAMEDIWAAFDGKEGPGAVRDFGEQIAVIGDEMGWPVFLRTDHTSAKHHWNEACFVAKREDVLSHIFQIAEFSELCSFMGLPWKNWAVREFLPTKPLAIAPRYSDMPVCREFRFFVTDGEVQCWHPYWPLDSLEQGGVVNAEAIYAEMCRCENEAALIALAEAAGRAVPGSWSIDILDTARGWFVTDMAEAEKSFHWSGCAFEKRTAA
jgi:hypothetical protein